MYVLCIESSHKKGMGHLFRALNIIDFLIARNEKFIVIINKDKPSNDILDDKNLKYEIVNLEDFQSDWETALIKKYGIDVWINDRLDTDAEHAKNVVKNNVKLVTFDDKGNGAGYADIHAAAMIFKEEDKKNIKGKKILTGVEYLILNKEIDNYNRIRNDGTNVIVTLGGSDTYGVTLKVVEKLKKLNVTATVVTGPSFMHKTELAKIVDERFTVKEYVPSLVKEFFDYDLAITGGGITPFEANAAGLPCIVIASEAWEINNGQYLDTLGSSKFAGFYTDFDFSLLSDKSTIKEMSEKGMNSIDTFGVNRVFEEIFK